MIMQYAKIMNANKFNELFYESMYLEAHKNLWCDPSFCPECLKEASLCDSSFLDQDLNMEPLLLEKSYPSEA